MITDRTLCLLVRDTPPSGVLLGFKKTGFGAGKYAGFGGKVEAGENIEAAAVRELEEEAGIVISIHNLLPIGRLTFLFPSKPNWDQMVHVFLVKEWTGVPQESDEMRPVWKALDALPFERMWDDAPHWLPLVLQGRSIDARFVYNDDNETVGQMEIKEWKRDNP
jgi:8-oxo-dGTP pyrophosphatase MutT (NUDIX family)